MNERREQEGCEPFAEALELYLEGELEGGQRRALDDHLSSCPSCRSELALAAEVRDSLRRLPSLEAPRRAVAEVMATARAEADASEWWQPGAWLRGLLARPALAVAGAAAALLVVILLSLFPGQPRETTLAADDPAVVRAALETKLALAHFARANRKIGLELGEDVLHERMVLPATRGVARSLGSQGSGTGRPVAGPNERG